MGSLSQHTIKVNLFLVFHLDFLYSMEVNYEFERMAVMRVMAIDYGDARTGIAISDPTGFLAGFTTVIHAWRPEVAAAEIFALIQTHGVEVLVMGYPKNMDGTEGHRAEIYRGFAALLERETGLTPVLWDERRTTIDAHRILTETGNRGKKRKEKVDAVAATLILEGYLAFLRTR